jgi:hypothetical protein
LLDQVPLWAVFLLTVFLVLISILIGTRVGLEKGRGGDTGGTVGSAVAAMLGLLAFVLTFTFGIASARFDTRKQLLLAEVNAIGTAALRAELLPEPQRSECRDLFRNYVDVRVEAMRDPKTLPRRLAESEALQVRLWSDATVLARANMNSKIGALFVESLNQVIDLNTSRKTVALQYRIPGAIWLGLGLVTLLSMGAMGFQFGVTGKPRWGMSLVLAMTFSTVVLLIAILDRPFQDIIKVDQRPLFELQQKLHGSAPHDS